MKRLLFATTNSGKLAELKTLVRGLDVEVLSPADLASSPEIEEDGLTFEDNARKKAEALRDFHGVAALADDSGLCVDALEGAPGVRSARFAGAKGDRDAANNALLLERLRGVPDALRGASFRCVLCFAAPGRAPVFAAGECRGVIGHAPRGSHGFGYDPLFVVPELGKTFAELSSEEKNRISHRRRAFDGLRPHLDSWAVRP